MIVLLLDCFAIAKKPFCLAKNLQMIFSDFLWLGSVILTVALAPLEIAFAITDRKMKPLDQINSVSDLSNISPTDWEFSALQSLAERYNCIGDAAQGDIFEQPPQKRLPVLTRYEFAISLNAYSRCIHQNIAVSSTNLVNQQDLATLRRLHTKFVPQLTTLQERLDKLKVQTTQLQPQQFSTTTKLSGEVIFAFTGLNGGNKADNNFILSNRVRLNFDTSFTGNDRLRVRLQAANIPSLKRSSGTEMARLGFEADNNNEFEISRLEYRFPIGKQATVYIEAAGGELSDFTVTVNPYFSSSSNGSISRFGRRNPIYRQSSGTGVGMNYKFSDAVSFSLGYIADRAENPRFGIGESPYGAIVQLNLEPIEDIEIGLTYVRSYNNLDTGTGSELANDPFDDESDRITANSYGIEAAWRLSRDFTFGGWVGFTEATAEDVLGKPEANIFNYAITFAFPDLGKEDNLAGIIIGQLPKVIKNDFDNNFQDEATSWHLEFFYRYQATDNIAITPGLLVITNPEHKQNKDTVYVGTIRTTFSF
ncbi:iron uptake porin [Nostoc sp. UCD121]|uniref:iron uptake porin n=1 Tax=Nostoc sp. UCD121 TaxID=2681305 RepID=UPI0021AB83F0|nr:iron uptake porin [Nostoc sp. UCD121]